MKIVPSLLSEDFGDFESMVRKAEALTDYVQIDVMDGVFVESRSFPVGMINSLKTTLSFELHLMTSDPLVQLLEVGHPGLKKVIFHAESSADPIEIIRKIEGRGLAGGLAVRPETRVRDFREYVEKVGTLLFLTVDPGRYGSPFKPEVSEKVAEARRMFPGKEIGVDGGISLDNLGMFYNIGVDYVCVGSRIFLHGSPEQNYKSFTRRLDELKGK